MTKNIMRKLTWRSTALLSLTTCLSGMSYAQNANSVEYYYEGPLDTSRPSSSSTHQEPQNVVPDSIAPRLAQSAHQEPRNVVTVPIEDPAARSAYQGSRDTTTNPPAQRFARSLQQGPLDSVMVAAKQQHTQPTQHRANHVTVASLAQQYARSKSRSELDAMTVAAVQQYGQPAPQRVRSILTNPPAQQFSHSTHHQSHTVAANQPAQRYALVTNQGPLDVITVPATPRAPHMTPANLLQELHSGNRNVDVNPNSYEDVFDVARDGYRPADDSQFQSFAPPTPTQAPATRRQENPFNAAPQTFPPPAAQFPPTFTQPYNQAPPACAEPITPAFTEPYTQPRTFPSRQVSPQVSSMNIPQPEDPTRFGYRDGEAFGFDNTRLYNPLEGPQLNLQGAPTADFGPPSCDEWEGFCRGRDLEQNCACGGLKVNPGHLGLPWLRSKDNCDQSVPLNKRRGCGCKECQAEGNCESCSDN